MLTADDVQAAERYLKSNEATPDGIRKVKRWLELEWFDWTNHARPDQLAPPGEWLVWVLLAGRGYGKTRTAAEWVKIKGLEKPKRRIALAGATLDDVRDTMVEGESGLLSIIPDHELRGGSRETAWNRSMAELYLANGTKYKGFSSNAPEKLRGPQHHFGWCFIAGTMIRTPSGEQTIQSLRPGDVVLTRNGPRPVEANGHRTAPLVRLIHSAGELVGTADHPIMTEKGWVALSALSIGDKLYLWNDDGGKTHRAITTHTVKVESSTAIESFGPRLMARSRPAVKSTTSITSRAMTGSRTLSALPQSSIGRPIARNSSNASVSYVGVSSSAAGEADLPSTAKRASGKPESEVEFFRPETASTAESASPPGVATSVVSGVSTLGLDGLVYNLRIAETPEYYANGVLVHNCDEPMTWEDADKGIEEPSTTWSNLMLGLRLGAKPQCVVSGTPRRRRMLTGRGRPGDEDYRPGLINMPGVVVTKGSTYDNLDNLAPTFKTRILDMYEGARIGRQELMAEILEDVEGAQWTQKLIDDHKNREQMWQGLGLYRVVIGVDPAVSSSETADFTGIIVAGQNSERHDFVLADRSLRGTPLEWANRAIRAYDEFGAECIVAEKNNGGELVMRNIHAVRPSVPVELVWAKQGKTVRAAPVVTRYEKGLVHHLTVINPLDSLARLEDEMTTWVARDSPESPDRLDAMVWAIWKLSIGGGQPLETEPYVQTGRRGR